MAALDVDAATLAIVAAASAHAYEQAIDHVEAEIKAADGNYEPLINTLVNEGPYAYTIIPEVHPDGSVKLPILTTREEIADAYAMIRGASDLLEVIGLTELRGSWYLFQDAIAKGRRKGADEVSDNYTLGLFPSGRDTGITGELVWFYPRSMLGPPDEPYVGADDPMAARRDLLDRYTRYLEALRTHDVDGILEVLHDGVASALRDYVNDTGTLTQLEGKDSHRDYYDAFFQRYEVRSVQPLVHHTEDRYVFAELRMTVAPRGEKGSSETLTYHTAEFFIPSKDGRLIARIGHGTEPVA
jgi:hypothetical protein